jgi:ankyrin repeat protein|eukprot:COSAG01_NODE_22115_length_871_cov_0.804404_2_plen_86_part_00
MGHVFKAAFDGRVQDLTRLLQEGGDPNETFEHAELGRWTPLHAACRGKQHKAATVLLGFGASVHAVDEVRPSLRTTIPLSLHRAF